MGLANRSPLVLALLFSALLHGALVLLVPGMTLPELLEEQEELLEFEVRETAPPQPEPEPEPIKQPEQEPEPQEAAAPEQEPLEPPEPLEPETLDPRPVVSELDAEKLTSTLRSELPVQSARTPKTVWLPTRREQRLTAETIVIAPPRQINTGPTGGTALKRVDGAPVSRGADMTAARETAKKLLASLGGLPSKVKTTGQADSKKEQAPGTPEIGGEVGVKRTVVRHPPPPTVKIDNPVTVEMEFWVSPAGDVIRAHALRTGEAGLDRAAAKYVKGFKFNALASGEKGQQRGTILVRFSWR